MESRKQRAADLRLGAAGMRYFGDLDEAEQMEREADRIDGRNLAGRIARDGRIGAERLA